MSKTVILPFEKEGGKLKCIFPRNFGICIQNVRTNLLDEEIKKVEFYGGRQRIDEIQGSFLKGLRLFHYSEKTVVEHEQSLKFMVAQKVLLESIPYKNEDIPEDCKEYIESTLRIIPFRLLKDPFPLVKFHDIEIEIELSETKITRNPEIMVDYIDPSPKFVDVFTNGFQSLTMTTLCHQYNGFESFVTENTLNTRQKLLFNLVSHRILFKGNPNWNPSLGIRIEMTSGANLKQTLEFSEKDIQIFGDSYCINPNKDFEHLKFETSLIESIVIFPSFEEIIHINETEIRFVYSMLGKSRSS